MLIIKEIDGFPEYYISENGDVFSKKGHWPNIMAKLKPQLSKFGYYRINLHKDKKQIHKSIHRLVAEAFIPNPEHKTDVNHKNGIRTDNRVENLEWATRSENITHAYRVLGNSANKPWKNKFGNKHNRAKTILQIKNGNIIDEFGSLLEAERITKINHSSISMCCTGKRHTAGRYQWKYKEQQ